MDPLVQPPVEMMEKRRPRKGRRVLKGTQEKEGI